MRCLPILSSQECKYREFIMTGIFDLNWICHHPDNKGATCIVVPFPKDCPLKELEE